jgi:hypothetical protein
VLSIVRQPHGQRSAKIKLSPGSCSLASSDVVYGTAKGLSDERCFSVPDALRVARESLAHDLAGVALGVPQGVIGIAGYWICEVTQFERAIARASACRACLT